MMKKKELSIPDPGLKYLTRKQAMALLQVSHQLMSKLLKEGLPCIRLGAKILIKQDSLDAFMKARETASKR